MAASKPVLEEESREARLDASGVGLARDFWGAREGARRAALAQGISWGCRVLGLWPDSHDLAAAGWKVAWPDLVLKPACATPLCETLLGM